MVYDVTGLKTTINDLIGTLRRTLAEIERLENAEAVRAAARGTDAAPASGTPALTNDEMPAATPSAPAPAATTAKTGTKSGS